LPGQPPPGSQAITTQPGGTPKRSAPAQLPAVRRKRFAERYVEPLVAEAGRLGIGADELIGLIGESSYAQGGIQI